MKLRQCTDRGCIFGIILLSVLSGCARAQGSGDQELFKDPIGSFVFDASLGNPAPPITVWYYRPDNVDPSARVVFSCTGGSRTGQEARDIGAQYAKKHDFVLLAPEFSEKDYPGDMYAFGHMLGPDGALLPESLWAFTTIERIFDRVRTGFRLSTRSTTSSGTPPVVSSFTAWSCSRPIFALPGGRLQPGRYALPEMSERFPYGFNGTSLDASRPCPGFFKRFRTSPRGSGYDDRVREMEAITQGGNRFARGLALFRDRDGGGKRPQGPSRVALTDCIRR
jgi:hypothetical protein